jgi:hypothetical protein
MVPEEDVNLVELLVGTVENKPVLKDEDKAELVTSPASQLHLITPEDVKAKRARLSNTPLTTMAGMGDGMITRSRTQGVTPPTSAAGGSGSGRRSATGVGELNRPDGGSGGSGGPGREGGSNKDNLGVAPILASCLPDELLALDTSE